MTDTATRGANGGIARAAKLSPEQRSSIAKAAAAKRWAKKDDPKPIIDPAVTKAVDHLAAGIKKSLDGILLENGIATDADILTAKLDTPVVLISGPTMQVPITYKEEPAPPKSVVKRKKPMVKEFGSAHAYAEKRLMQAIKERAEFMGKVAALNAEIPSLLQIIRALGGAVDPQLMQGFYQPPPTNGHPYGYQPSAPQVPPGIELHPQPTFDPNLFAANNMPVPGLAPTAKPPLMPQTAVGGAMDLDYVPVEEEGPGLPKMGGGWV